MDKVISRYLSGETVINLDVIESDDDFYEAIEALREKAEDIGNFRLGGMLEDILADISRWL